MTIKFIVYIRNQHQRLTLVLLESSSAVVCPFGKIVEKKFSGSRAVKPDFGHFEPFLVLLATFKQLHIYIHIFRISSTPSGRFLKMAKNDNHDTQLDQVLSKIYRKYEKLELN